MEKLLVLAVYIELFVMAAIGMVLFSLIVSLVLLGVDLIFQTNFGRRTIRKILDWFKN